MGLEQTVLIGGQEDLAAFLASDNTLDPLHNLAVVDAQLTIALARSLNLQKGVVQEITDHINRVSELKVRINRFKSTSTTEKDKPFGENKEDALAILNLLKAEGVKDLQPYFDKLQISSDGKPTVAITANSDDIGGWELALQSVSESLSNKSQQESLRLQTFTNRYTQASDQASTLLQKSAQSKSTISPNFRS
jgi:hypothetical protein